MQSGEKNSIFTRFITFLTEKAVLGTKKPETACFFNQKCVDNKRFAVYNKYQVERKVPKCHKMERY